MFGINFLRKIIYTTKRITSTNFNFTKKNLFRKIAMPFEKKKTFFAMSFNLPV